MTSVSVKILFVFLALAAVGQCIISLPLKQGQISRAAQPYTRKSYLRSTLTNKLVNFLDDIYIAEVQVGKSKQNFKVVFDTGSELFWIPSAECDTCKKADMKTYSCTEEDECTPSEYYGELQYATGYAAGNITHFNIGIPGTENVEYFGLLINTVSYLPSGFDGIIGLSPICKVAEGSTQPNLIPQLYENKQIEKPIVSFYQAFSADEKAGKVQSAITFGGYDESKVVGKIQYFKTVKQSAWYVPFEEFEVDGVKVYTEKGSALIDTGTTSFYLRPDIAEKYFDNIQLKRGIKIGDEYDVPCDSDFPSISFSLRNVDGELIKFEIEPSFYVTPSLTKKNVCYLYFEGLIGNGPQMVIGNTVLRKYLPIFDYENNTIGLGRTINQPPRTYHSKSEQ
ncbi:eukaryotic aspartyl protease (macronuclear) [Tetrahymena thermophila SB210]|uniref:Eukaryotic aspartyl protease n=1 Tax=Tetrahymena thermophila (strain SB210) TaxID=312017 RepID=Q235M3_TETTS|nr:eukaryotic aspartyl protease [Tetrahymena thermophila SB210]EAR92257.1 eukaryotic aspartyl protease [Tetrahymena thermophila SB210]|eukprot:XP_001012502.1 eukaryotic aspartyl protease [Tetrahymena thermophila SB210]